MNSMPEPTTNDDQINDSRLPGTVAELRAAAVTALQPYNPLNREHVESMLLFWVRRAELTAADVAAVQEAMFPEPEDSTGHPTVPGDDGGFAERFLRDRRRNDNPDYREGYATGYLDAVQQAVAARKPRTVPNILPTPVTPLCVVHSPNYCSTHKGVHPADLEELRELLGCPDWCVSEHTGDNPADPVENLILHFAAEHIPGIQVSRCDCPAEGWLGKPALRVRVELELETWEQAAELARAVLDGFGYLAGADQP